MRRGYFIGRTTAIGMRFPAKIAAISALPLIVSAVAATDASADIRSQRFQPAHVAGSSCSGAMYAVVDGFGGGRESSNDYVQVELNFVPDSPLGPGSGSSVPPKDVTCTVTPTVTIRNLDTGQEATEAPQVSYTAGPAPGRAVIVRGYGTFSVRVSTNPDPAEIIMDVSP